MLTTCEEAVVMMVQEAYQAIIRHKRKRVQIVSDDTDVSVLPLFLFWKLQMEAEVLMEPTRCSRNVVDMNRSVQSNKSMLAAHSVSGCDTTRRYYGIGKGTALKKLRVCLKLEHLGELECDFGSVYKESVFIASFCYGFPVVF